MPYPQLHHTYAAAVPDLSVPWQADAVPGARIAWLNEELAQELGYDPDWLRSPAGLALLTGQLDADGTPRPNGTPRASDALDPGGAPAPLPPDAPFTTAQVYAGHQFGQANPQLGDGRAVLLGDLVDTRGHRRDLHLKGSGRTPFARAGDGKAPLGPMLREAVIGESLHALGVPTTRALAVVATGERIRPQRGITPEPGAVLTRVADSHLRVGTFEYAAWHLGPEAVRTLADHAIDRHHPAVREEAQPYLGLLREVSEAQARLVAQWMLLGFVHGVMNTDNMTISGQGIDYGPCAFLDEHRARAVFSSIDQQGRYAYGNQPGIALWNLSRFAETLLPLLHAEPQQGIEAATAVLEGYEGAYLDAWTRGMAAKLGLRAQSPELRRDIRVLGEDLLALLESQRIDHTGFFRALGEGRGAESARELFATPEAFDAWEQRRQALRGAAVPDAPATSAAPIAPAASAVPAAPEASANPMIIPRNVHLESALRAAHLGDLSEVETMIEAVSHPFDRRPEWAHLEGPGDGGDAFMTFCGT